MIRRVEISARALRDYERIIQFLLKRSRQGAAAWADAFDEAVSTLPDRFEQHPLAPEDANHDETIRNVLFRTRHGRTYRAIYLLRGDAAFVLHIRQPGQSVVEPDRFYRT